MTFLGDQLTNRDNHYQEEISLLRNNLDTVYSELLLCDETDFLCYKEEILICKSVSPIRYH